MIEFDDGSGPATYVAGDFESIAGIEAQRIARFDADGNWSAVGSGIPTDTPYADWVGIWTMTVFDDGNGPALYVGGNFTFTSELHAQYVAKWDGTQWSDVGWDLIGAVTSLAVFDDGSGPALYAGGAYWDGDAPWANASVLGYVARWDGELWNYLSMSFDRQYSDISPGAWVDALHVFDDGTGPALYVGGWFDLIDDAVVASPARWDGTSWSSAGGGAWYGTPIMGDDGPEVVLEGGLVSQFFEHDGKLYIAGRFRYVDSQALHEAFSIAAWDGEQWHLFGDGLSGLGFELAIVTALHVLDVDDTPHVYAGGYIVGPGGSTDGDGDLHPPVRWNGSSWETMGGGVWGHIGYHGHAQVVGFHAAPPDSSGRAGLYVFGKFMRTGELLDGVDNSDIAIWRECSGK